MAILGGWSNEEFPQRLGDIVLFDSRTHSSSKVMATTPENEDDLIKFNAIANQCGRTKSGTVVALVSD